MIGRWVRGLAWIFASGALTTGAFLAAAAGHPGLFWIAWAIAIGVHLASAIDVLVLERTRDELPGWGVLVGAWQAFVKRVIGMPGDTIEIVDGVPHVNGHDLARKALPGECRYDDLDESIGQWESRACTAFEESSDGRTWEVIQDPRAAPGSRAPVVVPPGHLYVMGDNRDNSHDSRYWGFVPAESVKGIVRSIWYSAGPQGIRWDRVNQTVH